MSRSTTTPRRVSHSVEETLQIGTEIGAGLAAGDVVALRGELGSGKTHLVKGICAGRGHTGVVSSPTFTLINDYGGEPAVFHVDLYRLDTEAQVRGLGLEELMGGSAIVIIEWPERGGGIIPATAIQIDCEHGEAENERIYTIHRA